MGYSDARQEAEDAGRAYELLSHDRTNRWMLILEATIVLLFVIDLVILFVGISRGVAP